MSGSALRNALVVVGLMTGTAAFTYVLSSSGSASAAQTSGAKYLVQAGPCWHVGLSDWECPDSMAVNRADQIASISVTIETTAGRRVMAKLPAGVDAMFFTKDAAEKFLVSYYWATNRTKAEALLRRIPAIKEPAAR